jgi:hypothetical protein
MEFRAVLVKSSRGYGSGEHMQANVYLRTNLWCVVFSASHVFFGLDSVRIESNIVCPRQAAELIKKR